MNGVCQGVKGFFRVVVALLSVPSGILAASPPEKPARPLLAQIEVVPWPEQSFPELVLISPDLASALMTNPTWRSLRQPSWEVPEADSLASHLGALLAGVVPARDVRLRVVVGVAEGATPGATVTGNTAVVRWPLTPPASASDLARTLAPALLTAVHIPAAPDPACSEPLLALAEALVRGGSLALAALPPVLRPVSDWFELRDAGPPVATFAAQVLDPKVPWRVREAHANRTARGGGSPELANAAAVLLEAFGDSELARHRPCELLRSWRAARGKPFPPLPATVRRAIDEGTSAGLPTDARTDLDVQREVGDIARSALQRVLDRGEVPPAPLPPGTPLLLRARAAANARAKGLKDACALLGEPLPSGLRTGCRERDENGGWVYVRPGENFELVARAPSGEEAVLLRWPRWALFPQVGGSGRDLYFIDQDGVQYLDLAGGTPVQLHWPGSFRTLARRPRAEGLAVVSWPSGEVWVEIDGQRRALGVKGRGGIAWLDRDLLVAADEDVLALASLAGESRRLPVSLPCVSSLAVTSGALLAGQSSPCEPALVRINVADATSERILSPGFSPLGVLPLPDGSLVLGGSEGLYRWSGAGSAERIGVGLTPGPG